MSELLPIIGAGGGGKAGGSSGGLKEEADNLKSSAYAQVLDLVCEGEIGGLVDGLKSIYLDNTPVQNADGSMNFTGVQYTATLGTQSQAAIAAANNVTNEVIVGVEAKISPGPVVRSITNLNITSVNVTVLIPGLTNLSSDGNLGGTNVNFAIDVNNNGGGWVELINDTISGKSSSAYERQYRIALPTGGPWDIRLRRITADSTSSNLNNKTTFKTYTEIIDAKMRYPNSAIVALKIEASQFRSIPRRGYDMKLLKIRFPTNATVRTDGSLLYAGTWDGNFQVGWCADPAWAYYDLLTVDRYGLGSYIDSAQVDKWSLYTISKYCNELISDGFGGTEPRFTCNVWINTRQEAFKVLNDFTSVFRGMAYWGTGTVTAVQDAPSDPVVLFTNANVIEGKFTYQGSSAKARHTVALVAWNDPADLYRQKIEYVDDPIGIARYGIIETEIVAFGCTSRGQAARLGRWLLYSERLATEVVAFRTGIEGANCRPGNIVAIADQFRAGQRLGGRIVSATSTTVTVDALPTYPGGALTLYVVDGLGVVESRTVTAIVGNVLTVGTAFGSIPVAQMGWVLSATTLVAQQFRVLSVTETEEGEHEVSCLTHDPGKYALVETGLSLPVRVISNLSATPAKVASITFTESLYLYQNDVRSKITVSWPAASGTVRYRIEWRNATGNWESAETSSFDFEILNTTASQYEVRVYSIGVFGAATAGYTYGSYTAAGKTAPPSDVTGFLSSIDTQVGVTLTWNSVPDIDLAQYELRVGASWAAGTLVARVKSNRYVLGAINGTAQSYWIKAVDTSGIYSSTAATTTTTFPAPGATTLTAQVIDNNVLLKWVAVTSTLALGYYEIRKGATWAGGTVVGRQNSTFTVLFESVSGSYTYWIAATDIGGNTATPVAVTATVNQPPDYILMLNSQSTFSGTKTNALLDGGILYLGVDITSDYQTHFTANSWADPQAQITAGFPQWIEKTTTTASYVEVLDYGTTIASAKVSVVPTITTPFGSATIAWKISVSNTSNTGPWTDFAGVTEAFATTFRWIKVTLDITTVGGDDIVQMDSLLIKIDAKQKTDTGTVSAVAGDAGGTTVTFAQAFSSVASITLTPLGTTARYAIYDFAGGANPTTFKVLLYDSAGARLSGTVSWTARGF